MMKCSQQREVHLDKKGYISAPNPIKKFMPHIHNCSYGGHPHFQQEDLLGEDTKEQCQSSQTSILVFWKLLH